MSKGYRVSDEEGLHLCTYSVRILSVKMKVKFQCKMKIQLDSEAITSEVPIADGSTFVFNQDCFLVHKNSAQEYFTLSINLITNKGAKYIAGLAFLYMQELARSVDAGPTSRIVVVLSKCLDPEATLEIMVKQAVKNGRGKTSASIRQESKQKRGRIYMMNHGEVSQAQSRKIFPSPPQSPRGFQFSAMQNATKSEVNLPRAMTMIRPYDPIISKADSLHKGNRSRSRRNASKHGQKNLIQSGVNLYQNNSSFPLTDRDRQTVDYGQLGMSNERGSSGYKDSYFRLKERLRKQQQISQKQHDRRITIQNSQTNVKLESLKFKLRCEELEKNLNDKNGNIKKLQTRIEELQRLIRGENQPQPIFQKNIQINPSQRIVSIQEESAISVLESKVTQANRQLEELRNKILKITRNHGEKQNLLIKQLERKNNKIAKLEQQALLTLSSRTVNSKNQESLKLSLQGKEKMILQLEREQQESYHRISESEKVNKMLQKNLMEAKSHAQELNRTINLLRTEKQKIADQVQAEKNRANMAEFTISGLKKNIERIEMQLQSMQKFKQKYHDALVEVKRLEGERKLEQKNYENATKLNTASLATLQNKYKQESLALAKKNQELQSKSMQQIMKIKELETQINSVLKNEIDNYRKTNQKLQKECEEYRSGERMARKQQSHIEGRLSQLQSQVQVWKNKFKSLQNVSKLQSDKYIGELNRIKSSLQQQLIHQLSLKQKNQSQATELAITTSKLMNLEEKYNKQIKQANARLELEINKSNRLQQVIKKQEAIHNESRDKYKQLISKIEQYGESQSEYSELIKRYEHELSRIKSSLAISEEKMSSRQDQGDQLQKQLKQITDKYNALFHKSQQQSYTIKNLNSQLQKQIRQKQKLELEINSLKAINQNKDKMIEKQKLNIEQEVKNKMEIKQQLSQFNASYDTIAKEYQRFKEHVHDLLIRELTGVDGLDSLGGFQIKSRENQITLKDSLMKNNDPEYMRNSQKAHRTTYQQGKMSKSVKTLNYQNSLTYSPSTTILNNSDIINIINQFAKQSKGLLSKMIQEYRILEKEIEEYREDYQQKESKYVHDAEKAESNIHQLEDQISKLFAEKEGLEKKFQLTVHDYEQEINKLREEVEKGKQKLEQAIFTCNGVRMEKQTEKDYYELKLNQSQTIIKKLQSSLQNVENKCQKSEQANSKMKSENEDLSRQCRKYKEEIQFKERRIRQLQHELSLKLKLCEDLSIKNKAILTQVSELQISLNNEKEKNGKNLEIISQQERKLTDTKDFVNNLIKQKEAIVKQDIANGQKILELQSIKLNLESQLQNATSKLQKKISQIATQKDNSKKLAAFNRQLQSQLSNLKQQNRKLSQQLKQKQKQLIQTIQSLKAKQSQHSKQIMNKNRELQQLSSNKQLVDRLNGQQILNLKKQIERLEEDVIKKMKEEMSSLNGIQQMITLQLEDANRSIEQKNYEINSYKEVMDKLNVMRDQQQQTISNLTDELREKEEQLYHVSGQLSQLQQKYHQTTQAHIAQKQHIEQQFDYKYDNICEDYETKLDEMQRERDYLKQKLLIAEEESLKNLNKLKLLEEEENRERLISKDRIAKTEEQKNITVNNLKSDLRKAIEQRDKFEMQIQKINTERQNLRSSEANSKALIQKLEARLKQCESKLEQIQTQAYQQLQAEKKKDLYLKQFEESVVNYQWVLQRQVKKQLQNVTKSIISSSTENPESKRRFTDAIKDVEMRISRLVGERIVPGNPRIIGN